jgi:general secretion pathway protein N
MSLSSGRKLAIAATALVAALVVVLAQAPAGLVASAVRSWSAGRVALGDPSGTLWDGQADLILTNGDRDSSFRTRLPGRTAWHISPWRLLLGSLDLTLTNAAALDAPLALRMDRAANATVDANRLRVPAEILVGLGAPWNTIRPGGELQLEWDTLHLQSGALLGNLRAEWIDASSGLSPVVPFGHYRLQADGFFDGAQLQLDTISGPMEMTGSGTIADGKHLRFRGSAGVQPGTDESVATQLSGLISLLGRRDGDRAILNFGK